MPTIRAVLFDMDDTLIDWSGFNFDWSGMESRRMRRVYDLLCGEGHLANVVFDDFTLAYRKRWIGAWEEGRSSLRAPHFPTVLSDLVTGFGVPPLANGDGERLLAAYGWEPIAGVTVFPDVPPTLAALRARGVRTGIVTNAGHPMAMRDVELAHYGLLEYFPECRLSAADVGVLKPHPRIFETAMRCLGVGPEETLFVGDNPVADIGGAQRAGMRGVLRRVPANQAEIHHLVHADYEVNTFDELLPILDALNDA
jgi:putative hydrolase of the HAD superfamily